MITKDERGPFVDLLNTVEKIHELIHDKESF